MNASGLIGIFVLVLVVRYGDAIQCWECTSDEHGRCADHFNTTYFPRTSLVYSAVTNSPRLVNCDSPQGYGYQRQVCLKRVETDKRFQRTTYTRQCHTLVGEERVGTCPKTPTYSDITIDFCEYCDTHECNGVQGMISKSGMATVVIFLAGAVLLSL